MSLFRSSLAVAATAALLIVTAGCSSSSPQEPAASTPAAPSAAGESVTIGDITITDAGDGTRTIDGTMNGTVTGVPAEPERVIALWRVGSELAELGVVPVGSLEGEFLETELGPDLFATVDDIPAVGSFEGVDIEEVIAADPDLIIGMDNGGLELDYAPLAEIAPTVILKIAEPTDVWRNYPTVAAIVGKSTDFDERQAQLDADLEAIADEYGDALAGKPVTVVNSSMDKIWASTSKSLVYERLIKAGFEYNPAYTDNPDRYVAELTAENLADLSDQAAIFYQTDLNGTPLTGTDELRAQASYQRLPAVAAGLEFPLTSGVIYTFVGAAEQVADIRAAAEAIAAAG